MNNKKLSLGIDTSNYTTSVALTDLEGNILCDHRRLLSVKEGNRGLRQQEALFQHVNNLPQLMTSCFGSVSSDDIGCICVSSRPRNLEGSYMPCFNAGVSAAEMLGSVLKVPVYHTSHQEGHLEAARKDTELEGSVSHIFCHLSGGTCEMIDVDGNELNITGGSLDISFGQLLDRTAVAMGLSFPGGKALDKMAMEAKGCTDVLSEIKCLDGRFNLSGIETQIMKAIENGENSNEFIAEIFTKVTKSLSKAVTQVCEITSNEAVLFAGGVSSSAYIRDKIGEYLGNVKYSFGETALCSDNAVGVSLIGGRLWQQTL